MFNVYVSASLKLSMIFFMVIKILLVPPPKNKNKNKNQKNKKKYFLSYHLFIPPPCITYSVSTLGLKSVRHNA